MNKQRKIIHVDMDCFYAAIEIRDDPSLKGKPVAVGGASNSRGVLCTCNYEARKFGIHSAMPSSQAVRQCPDLIIVPVNFEKYQASSKSIHQILNKYTDIIEPLSLDEAFLDVSDSDLHAGSATRIAQSIRDEIYDTEKLVASAGISFNKLLAKIASDWNKPNGQFVITPQMTNEFMTELPVKKLFGVGKVTEEKLKEKNISVCGDIQKYSQTEMIRLFGNYGKHLHLMAHGIDDRPVSMDRIRKSLSVEETFSLDVSSDRITDFIFEEMF
ncbi:MAG: DNA polymerase IV, partial [Gammaproteobacteria bacterium]|nr:DNA polymerase IV [Gammaproteobacteria bacterium]